jgi:NitT/TauT family transport system substrate-binding protein
MPATAGVTPPRLPNPRARSKKASSIVNAGGPHRPEGGAVKHSGTIIAAAAAFLGLAGEAAQAQTRQSVTFATNWLAQAEHGGHYQAVADGAYAKYGLDVRIVQGGPQANNRLLLAAGKIDFYMTANLIPSFTALEQKIPVVSVAAMFQKDPFILMSHPGQGLDGFEELSKATAFMAAEARAGVFQWLRTTYGFSEANIKTYSFNPAPFIADKKSIQQGYLTSEPFAVEQAGKFKPNIFLAADHGFDTYSTLIETRVDTVEKRPDLVQRFVDASIIGWYNYLYGDNRAANALIKRDNPDITDAQIAFSIEKMKEYGIVDSGDTLTRGIGAMTDERVASFYGKMVKAGVVKPGLDIRQAYTTRFVNKGVGLDLRPKK